MHKIQITCDSACDLSPELYEKYHIEAVPMGISLGDDFGLDGVDYTTADIFDFVSRTGQLPKTSAVPVGQYMDVFGKYTEQGIRVIHISLSSELSSSYQNACIAAQSMENVAVIDSRNLSSGAGHLALLAAELAESGKAAEEITAILEEKKQKLDVSFVLQTLDYLHKGGRCSGVAAFGANLMKLRPEIEVTDGKMGVGKKYRGDLEKSVTAYIKGRLEGRTDVDLHRIFLTHSGVTQEAEDKMIALVKSLQPFDEVLVTTAGCTISCHCGPNCLGVLFFTKD